MSEALQSVRDWLAARLAEIDRELAAQAPTLHPLNQIAWGARVSDVFKERVRWIASDLDIGPAPGRPAPDWIMTWIAWESGRSFRADVRNMAGSGATGLIQFMPATALPYFHTAAAIKAMTDAQKKANGIKATNRLAAMTPEDQLNYVWRYFAPFKGKIRTLSDGYMAILWPKGVGQPDSYVLWNKASRPTTYRQNAGLDINKDGSITKAEAAAKVGALLPEGLRPENMG